MTVEAPKDDGAPSDVPEARAHPRAGSVGRAGAWLSAHRTAVGVAAGVSLALAVGYFLGTAGRAGGAGPSDRGAADGHDHSEAEKEPLFWTCSMHPQVRQPGPGKCPICAMDLIPASEGSGEASGPRELRLSEAARKLASIRTSPVERRFVEAEVRMVGKVDYDETRLAHITAWVPGRIDRLYADYTGITVGKGDHMVWLYSPEILSAQEELLQAVKAARELVQSGSANMKRTALATVKAAREKLRLWGLGEEQVREIEERGEPSDHITIRAPIGGIVVKKYVDEGVYVKTGERVYGIADLTRVWVKLDAYESDLAWVKYGQEVEFTVEAYPGEKFRGRVSFVDPVLDRRTRTVKLRVNVPNEAARLKPGMFVRAVVRAKVAAGGKVAEPELAGRWISPMHPEVVKDGPGKCDVCAMPLVPAEKLGYVTGLRAEAPLVIPATAPLVTGERAVVYVALPGAEGAYEGREVVLGPRAGDYYVVNEKGVPEENLLREGERVVTNGNFKIDSALQILAKPSMMSPEGGAPPRHRDGGGHDGQGAARGRGAAAEAFDVPGPFREQLDAIFAAYLDAQKGLAADDLESAKRGAKGLLVSLDGVDMTLLKEPAHGAWMKRLRALDSSAKGLAGAKDIASAREALALLSDTVIDVVRHFGASGKTPLFRYRCTMAFGNRGADWLSGEKEVRNPYYGSEMLKCGDFVEAVAGGGKDR